MYVCTYMYVCAHACMHVCVHVCVRMCVCLHMQCACECMIIFKERPTRIARCFCWIGQR